MQSGGVHDYNSSHLLEVVGSSRKTYLGMPLPHTESKVNEGAMSSDNDRSRTGGSKM